MSDDPTLVCRLWWFLCEQTRWFYPDWYRYLFEAPWTWLKVWCRLRGHPNGPIYYNLCGTEPDPHCKDCRDVIG